MTTSATANPVTYRLYRHVQAPKLEELQNDPEYDFRRAVDNVGVEQGLGLGLKLATQTDIQPSLILHSEAPRAIITANLACQHWHLHVPFVPLKGFYKSIWFDKIWTYAVQYRYDTALYLLDDTAREIYMNYGQHIADEIRVHMAKHMPTAEGDVLVFGHGVWNCFVAWALADFPSNTEGFFPHLRECDELIVKGNTVKHVSF